MDTNSVKQSVVDSYGKLAKSKSDGILSKLFACCDSSENTTKVGETIGYSKEELEHVPENSNLGVGCGNPSSFSNIKKGDVVIDLGSGAGFDAFIVAPLVAESGRVIGIDLSQDMLDLARRNAKNGDYNNVEFVKGDIEDLPLDDEIADHIISNCVINLSLNKDKVYEEAFRVLKPGGRLSVSDIVLGKELPDYVQKSLAGHIACVSGAEKIEDYLQYVEDAGFSDIKVEAKSEFPLELMLGIPEVASIAETMNFNLDSEEAKDIASRVTSISITATKI